MDGLSLMVYIVMLLAGLNVSRARRSIARVAELYITLCAVIKIC